MKSVCLCLPKGIGHLYQCPWVFYWVRAPKEKDSGLMVTDSVRDNDNNNMAPSESLQAERFRCAETNFGVGRPTFFFKPDNHKK